MKKKCNKNSIVIMTHEQQQELIESAVRKALHDYNFLHKLDDQSTRLLTAKEAQAILGCSATTLWRLGKLPNDGLYPIHLAPHKIAYNMSDIEEYIANHKTYNKNEINEG